MKPFATALALAGGLALLQSAPVATAQTIELKFSHFVPPVHPFHRWAVDWAERVEKESGGRLKVTLYPAGQLVGPPHRQFDAARTAITDIAYTLHGVTPGRYPVTDLVNLPFSFPGKEPDSAVMSRRLTELGPKYLAAEHKGLHILMMAVAPPVVFNSRVAVKTLDGFKGLRVRYAGAANKEVLDAIGAVPMLVPPPESQEALARGIIDAALFPHEAAVAFDLASVAKFAIEPPISSVSFAMVMNPAKYKSLPPDLREVIDRNTGPAAAEDFGRRYQQAEIDGRNQQIKRGVQIIHLPEADVQRLRKLLQPQVETAINALEKKGLPAREFYQAYTK